MLNESLEEEVDTLNPQDLADLAIRILEKLGHEYAPLQQVLGLSHGQALTPKEGNGCSVTALPDLDWNLITLDLDNN
jgi:hypothetical protein